MENYTLDCTQRWAPNPNPCRDRRKEITIPYNCLVCGGTTKCEVERMRTMGNNGEIICSSDVEGRHVAKVATKVVGGITIKKYSNGEKE